MKTQLQLVVVVVVVVVVVAVVAVIIVINLKGSGNNKVEKTLQYLEGLREEVFYLEVLYGRE